MNGIVRSSKDESQNSEAVNQKHLLYRWSSIQIYPMLSYSLTVIKCMLYKCERASENVSSFPRLVIQLTKKERKKDRKKDRGYRPQRGNKRTATWKMVARPPVQSYSLMRLNWRDDTKTIVKFVLNNSIRRKV